METKTEKPRRSWDPLWDKRNFAAYSQLPQPSAALHCSSAAWMGNRETCEDNSPERWRDGERIDFFTLDRKHSTGRREEIPTSGCILPKNPQCKLRLSSRLKHRGLVQTKTQPRSLLPTFGFRFSSKLFISPQPNVHPYRKQVLLSGSWVVLNIFWGWFLTQMQQEASVLF